MRTTSLVHDRIRVHSKLQDSSTTVYHHLTYVSLLLLIYDISGKHVSYLQYNQTLFMLNHITK